MNKANTIPFRFDSSLDRDYLHRMYGDDLEFASDMFQLFLETVADGIPALEVAVGSHNVKEIGSWVHKLRPCYSMVGLDDLFQMSDIMEEKGVENYAIDELGRLTRGLIDKTRNRLTLIQSEYNRMQEAMIEQNR